MLQAPSAPALFPRFLAPRVEEALADTPVVLISGPRQSGKTTLARQLAAGRSFLILDSEPTHDFTTVFAAASVRRSEKAARC